MFLFCALSLVILLSNCNSVFSQSIEEQMATQYMRNGEFEKAAVSYEKLFHQFDLPQHYQSLLDCYLELKNYASAEKLIKKQLKKKNFQSCFLIDLGYLYSRSEQADKTKKYYNQAIEKLPLDQSKIIETANAFTNRKEIDYTIATYLKGRQLMRGVYPFNFELAEAYNRKGDIANMIAEYLDVLELGEQFLLQVQTILMSVIGDDYTSERYKLFKSELFKKTQLKPDNLLYNELIIWALMQEKDFNAALAQTKAIDIRKKEDGARIISLAQVCVANVEFDVASKCYEYMILKGKDNYFYNTSRIELVNVLYLKITKADYLNIDLINLETNYLATLSELGRNAGTITLMKGLAHLYAFYLHQPDKAIDILNESINLTSVNQRAIAECKMELADVLVFTGEMYDSNLLYAQVELAFKEDPLGQDAKFRNARLSYYKGDFAWAQAQLDVLKASTSKLISNDALQLSLQILDNSGLDTSTDALLMFSRAELYAFQNKDNEAMKVLDSINAIYIDHDLNDDILMKKASIEIKRREFEKARILYDQVLEKYGTDILADDALFKLAELYDYKLNNSQKAMELYQKLLTDFPGSFYIVDARKRYRKLRGDKVN